MSEYRKQSDFLKSLLAYDETLETHALLERLTIAERNECCIYSACRLVGMVGILGFFGLGYSAVLLPGFFDNSSHFLIQLCSALGLGSAMCLAVFVGLWLWYRAASNKVRAECRRTISRLMETRFRPDKFQDETVIRQAPYFSVFPVQPATSADGPKAGEIPLRKAS